MSLRRREWLKTTTPAGIGALGYTLRERVNAQTTARNNTNAVRLLGL